MHDADQLEAVMRYHERTKHDFGRYAPGPRQLDWANQPNPFRRFEGAPLTRLPLLGPDDEPTSPSYDDLYRPAAVPIQAHSLRSISRLLELALAISASKEAGAVRWALRCNPSSGNLHPTEGYLLVGPIAGLSAAAGVYHYAAAEHGLERRADCPVALYARLTRDLPPRSFLIGLSSVHWREAWKYGERAFRYCQHDIGHAVGALRLAAAGLGWRASLLDAIADETVEGLFGLDRDDDFAGAEREHPDLVLAVWPREAAEVEPMAAMQIDPAAARELASQRWYGRANRLSREDPLTWAAIDEVARATRKSAADERPLPPHRPPAPGSESGRRADRLSARQVILQRRSLLACDGHTSLAAQTFYRILARTLPHAGSEAGQQAVPWDALAWRPTIHLGLFVHRVDGIEPGLYLLVRDPAKGDALRAAMHPHFEWSVPPECPSGLALRLLQTGDARRLATQLSCFQDIAGDGAFSLGMIAEYREPLLARGPWFYRRLFWEAGLIGQVLYLEAEAAGVRATGIGCFFDDPVHRVFGLGDLAFQSLYHFTVGGPVDDARLTTLPPYGERTAAGSE